MSAGSDPSGEPTGPGAQEPHPPTGKARGKPLRAAWDPTGGSQPRRPREASRSRAGRSVRKPSALGRFVATYGWRAYALPVLVVVTIFVVLDAIRTGADGISVRPVPGFGQLSPPDDKAGIIGVPPGGSEYPANLPTGALPDGGPFAEQGERSWRVVPGANAQVGQGERYVFAYTVEIEDGVETLAYGGDESVARMVDSTLANPKSWIADSGFAFQRIDSGEPDFRISLTARETTRAVCGFEIPIDSSCYNADAGRVVLSEARWVRGAVSFEGDVGSYRQYLVNHEVGHAIGYHQHQPCESDGALAPVMMQQTFGTENNAIASLDPDGVVPADGKKCQFNPWPYPRG